VARVLTRNLLGSAADTAASTLFCNQPSFRSKSTCWTAGRV